MTDINELRAAKAAAKDAFGASEGVQGFGIGDGTVRVYCLNTDAAKKLPDEINGVPIEKVISGEIVAANP